MAVIVSSHLLSEMELMCDRIAIIQNGKLRDIQQVHVPAADEKKRYYIQADDTESLIRQAAAFGDMKIEKAENGIELSLRKDDMPDFIKHLTDSGARLYEVKAVNKSLEDRFLEITADKGRLSMFNLIVNEWIKIFNRKGTYFMIGILLLSVIGLGILTKTIGETDQNADWKKELAQENADMKEQLKGVSNPALEKATKDRPRLMSIESSMICRKMEIIRHCRSSAMPVM